MARLVVSDIVKSYQTPTGPREVLSGLGMSASDKESIAVLGPSGSGKSTLLNIIGSLDSADSGSVRCNDIEVETLSGTALSDFRCCSVGFVFQDHHLLPQLSIVDNVLLPTIPSGKGADKTDRALELLDRMGIKQKAHEPPSKLSGGERQRAAVARALINAPALLLCDEPTGSLDSETGAGIISLLLEIAAESSVTIIVVTHNLAQADRLSRRLYLREGKLFED